MLLLAYGLSALLGAVAGMLVAPITFTSYDAGVMLGLKGFSAAILGGMGNSMGAVAGGLLVGILESLGAGMISSGYMEAIGFVVIHHLERHGVPAWLACGTAALAALALATLLHTTIERPAMQRIRDAWRASRMQALSPR